MDGKKRKLDDNLGGYNKKPSGYFSPHYDPDKNCYFNFYENYRDEDIFLPCTTVAQMHEIMDLLDNLDIKGIQNAEVKRFVDTSCDADKIHLFKDRILNLYSKYSKEAKEANSGRYDLERLKKIIDSGLGNFCIIPLGDRRRPSGFKIVTRRTVGENPYSIIYFRDGSCSADLVNEIGKLRTDVIRQSVSKNAIEASAIEASYIAKHKPNPELTLKDSSSIDIDIDMRNVF